MNIQSTNEQKVPIKLTPKTAAGNTVPVDGPVKWEVLSGDPTTDFPDDGTQGFIISGSVGTSQVKATADADLGEGVKTIEVIFDYTVVSALADSLGVEVGEAVPK